MKAPDRGAGVGVEASGGSITPHAGVGVGVQQRGLLGRFALVHDGERSAGCGGFVAQDGGFADKHGIDFLDRKYNVTLPPPP